MSFNTCEQILVVRALQLGDLICAVPALRALRNWKPNAHIALCSLPWAKEFVERYDDTLDEFIEFPGCPGIPEQPLNASALVSFIHRMRRRRFDLAIQLHGSGTYINDFVQSIEARRTAGFYPGHSQCTVPGLALDVRSPWPEQGHEIQRLKSIMLRLGASDTGDELEFPIRADEFERAERLLASHGISSNEPIICLHAGGRTLTRRWPAERFAEVAVRLVRDGWRVCLTGAGSEARVAAEVQAAAGGVCINLAGQTTLGEVAAVIDRAALLLSNDTGVSHIAAARRTRSLILVLGSEPERWFPLNRQLHSLLAKPVPCRPCPHMTCPIGFDCVWKLSVDEVYSTVTRLLSSELRSSKPRLSERTSSNPISADSMNSLSSGSHASGAHASGTLPPDFVTLKGSC